VPQVHGWRQWATRYLFGRDFFISYSRRDATTYAAALARRLDDRYSCYLDQLATPRGEALPMPIQRELRRATVLILVGSAGAIQSAYVGDELKLFLESGRPILLVDVDGQLAGAAWGRAPWSQLVGVYHQAESREAFERATPSDALIAYLSDSFAFTRQDRRLRTASGAAVLLLLAVLAIGGLVTAVTTRWANEAAARAAEQERVATSNRLASESSVELERNPSLAIQLAANAQAVAPTAAARRALLDGLTRFPGLLGIMPGGAPSEPQTEMLSGRDGRWFMTADRDRISVWDADTLQPRTRVDLGGENHFGVAVTPNGAHVGIGRMDHVSIRESQAGKEIGRVPATTPGAIAFVGDTALAVASGTKVELWDVTTPAAPRMIERQMFADEVKAIAVDPNDGETLAVATAKTVFVCEHHSCAKGRTAQTTAADGSFDHLAMGSGDEGGVLVAMNQLTGRLVIWHNARGRIVDLLIPPLMASRGTAFFGYDVYTAAVSQDGQRVAVGSARGHLLYARIDDLEGLSALQNQGSSSPAVRDAERMLTSAGTSPVRQLEYPPGLVGIAFVSGGAAFAVAQEDGQLSLWDVEERVSDEDRWSSRDLEAGGKTELSADGRHVLFRDRSGALRLADMDDQADAVSLASAFPNVPSLIVVAPDGTFVAGVPLGDARVKTPRALIAWDRSGRVVAQHQVEVEIDAQGFAIVPHTLVASGSAEHPHVVLGFDDGSVRAVDLSPPSPREVGRARLGARAIALSPTGRRVATVTRDGSVRLWEAATGAVDELPGPGTGVTTIRAITFSGEELLLAWAETSGMSSLLTWDVAARRLNPAWLLNQDAGVGLATQGDVTQPSEVALAPSGGLLALAEQKTIALWDTATHLRLATFTVPGTVQSMAFSLDGGRLLVRQDEGVSRFDVGASQLTARACDLAPRAFTAAEVQRYFGDAHPPLVCPTAK